MKIVGTMICFMTLAGLATAQEAPESQANQQQEKRLPHEVANPEKIATRITEQMQRSLQLTEKQYNKIYKLNLKEQKKRFNLMQNAENQGSFMRGGFGMGEGRPPMPMGGGEPPMAREGGFPGRMGERPRMQLDDDSAKALKKAAEAKDKKIKKILTTEQYEKWKAEQEANRAKAAQMRKSNDNRPRREQNHNDI